MKLIAHRGNIDGPNQSDENNPDYIDRAINLGYDAEIDLRYSIVEDKFYLGHDEPQYFVSLFWLAKRIENLWIHCKNIDALYFMVSKTGGYNYFWHQEDYFTLTSKNYIWTYPGQTYTSKSVIVMPENYLGQNLSDLRSYNCYGVCSDFISELK